MSKQPDTDKNKLYVVCQEISIDSSLNITDQLKKQKRQQFGYIDSPNSKNKHQTVSQISQVSLQNQLLNRSYTIINQADQDLLDQLDELLQAHHTNRTTMNNKKISKCNNEDDKDIHLYEKFQKLFNLTQQQSTRNKTQDILNTPNQNNKQTDSHLQDSSILEIHKELEDVEMLIKQYREQLNHYQNNLTQKITQSNHQNQTFKHNIDELLNKLETSQNFQVQQQKKINILTEQNYQMKAQLSKYISRSSRASKSKAHNNINIKTKFRLNELHHLNLVDEQTQIFSETVRQQLQDMIESLLVQVEHLRSVNQKLKIQIKTLNKQLLQSQKTIKKKNDVIYNLEMNVIHNKKQSNAQKPSLKLLKYSRSQPMIKSYATEYHYDQPFTKFSLSDVINKKKQINSFERIVIAFKIIECYEQKIDSKSYEMLMPQDFIICQSGNRWQSIEVKPFLIKSTSNRTSQEPLSKDKKENLIDNVLWNMNFILEELFKKDESRKINNLNDLIENTIRDKIDLIFEDKVGKKKIYLQQLKKILESCINVKES